MRENQLKSCSSSFNATTRILIAQLRKPLKLESSRLHEYLHIAFFNETRANMRADGSLKNYRKRLLNWKYRGQVLDVKVSRDTHNSDNATILRGVIRGRTLFTNFLTRRVMRLEITSFNLKNLQIFKLPPSWIYFPPWPGRFN